MRNETRELFEKYTSRIASLNGVGDASKKFTVEPSVHQTLENKIQESSDFLTKINMHGVRDLIGTKIGLGINKPIASRTNTANKARKPKDPTTLDENEYLCKFTEFDTAIPYAKLDQWAKFPDFQERIRDFIVRQQALDRIMTGFNGTSAAVESNLVDNPLLQDVNIGWLEKYRLHAPARVLKEGSVDNKIRVGKNGDYANLDSLVYDAVNELVDPWFQESTDLVAILGRKLLSDKYFPLINNDLPPSEQKAADLIISQKRVGGIGAVRVPFVPDGKILITSLENLSIYWQEEGRRRHIREEPDWSRVANYESSNDAYVVEDYGFGCLIENIELGDFS